MWSAAGRRQAGADKARAWRLVAAPALALAVAACAADGQVTGSLVSGRGATVAFESIDGPPQPVFQKLVENLASEAVARQVTVISREATPNYRIRGYMAAHLASKRIHIGWVWDVYDANKRRVLRIASEEPGGPAGRRSGDAWTAADDAMLRRIAQNSMDRLAAFLDPAARTPAAPPVDADGAAVAAAGDAVPPVSGESARQNAASTRQPQRAAGAPGLQAALALANTRP
jgi:hypothetical protein